MGHADKVRERAELIRLHVGRCNTDILAGWDVGLMGKQRLGHGLVRRFPPDHLYEPQNQARLRDWNEGYEAAQKYKTVYLQRVVHYLGENSSGPVRGKLKGWSCNRGHIVSRLEKQGCFGDVTFLYFEGSEVKRTHNCGI